MHQLYAKSLGKPCGYVPFFLESLKCGGFARSKPSLYRERWSVTRIKDKYYCVQFRTTENKTNYSPGKKFSLRMTREYRKRWYMGLHMNSRPKQDHSIWTIQLSHRNNWGEMKGESQHGKCRVLTVFLEQGFALVGITSSNLRELGSNYCQI